MGEATPRAVLLGMLRLQRGLTSRPSRRSARASASRRRRSPPRSASGSTADARRRAGPCRRRFSGLDRAVARAPLRRRSRAENAGARHPCALDLRVNTLKVASREEAHDALPHSRRRRDAALAAGPAHRAERGRPRPRPCSRARVPQGLGRDPGRGLAARGAALRREAGRAGGRPLRRRRRQDAGARGHDGEPRPDLRHRQRRPPPRADPRAARPAPARATSRSARRGPGPMR